MYESVGQNFYVTCFCGESDDEYVNQNGLLSQWRGYGDGGFAIVFDTRGIEELLDIESRQFNYARPGTTFEAVVSPDGKQVAITSKEFGFVGLANGMHRLHGYGGGRIYDAWAFLYDLASAALILFALTGIILWYQSTSRRLPGLICLGLSFSFSAAMILYLLYRK
jgi:hypothetical protein